MSHTYRPSEPAPRRVLLRDVSPPPFPTSRLDPSTDRPPSRFLRPLLQESALKNDPVSDTLSSTLRSRAYPPRPGLFSYLRRAPDLSVRSSSAYRANGDRRLDFLFVVVRLAALAPLVRRVRSASISAVYRRHACPLRPPSGVRFARPVRGFPTHPQKGVKNRLYFVTPRLL